MKPLSRMTAATVDVLSALIDGGESVWGLQIITSTGRPPGSVYPILERLERAGWITSEWEQQNERSGPRRRFYSLTGEGADAATAVIGEFAARSGAAPRTAAPASSGSRAAGRPVLPMLGRTSGATA